MSETTQGMTPRALDSHSCRDKHVSAVAVRGENGRFLIGGAFPPVCEPEVRPRGEPSHGNELSEIGLTLKGGRIFERKQSDFPRYHAHPTSIIRRKDSIPGLREMLQFSVVTCSNPFLPMTNSFWEKLYSGGLR